MPANRLLSWVNRLLGQKPHHAARRGRQPYRPNLIAEFLESRELLTGTPTGIVVTPVVAGPVGGAGTTVTINGQNLGTVLVPPTVQFTNATSGVATQGGTVTVTAVDGSGNGTQIQLAQPSSLQQGTYNVTVTANGGTSTLGGANTTYYVGCIVTGVSPPSGPHAGGTVITVTGANFTGANEVDFGGTPVTTGINVAPGGASLTVTTPALAVGAYDVVVKTPVTNGGTSFTSSADVFHAGATVSSVSPNAAAPSTAVLLTLTGADLAGATEVDFIANGMPTVAVTTGITVNGTGTSLTVTTPSTLATASYSVIVKTLSNGTSVASPNAIFNVQPVPTGIVVVTPGGAVGGTTTVTVNGQYLGTTANPPLVKFVNASTNASTNVTTTVTVALTDGNGNGTQINFAQPSSLVAGAYNIIITNASGPSTTSPTTIYYVGPVVTGVSPPSGPANAATPVTVSGANLTGATEVDFGATAVTTGIVVNAGGTSLTVTAPSSLAVGSYNVVVKTPNGTSPTVAAAVFSVGATVTGVSPGAGAPATAVPLTISGSSLTGATEVDFIANSVTTKVTTGITVNGGGTSLTVTTPNNLSAQTYSVVVKTTSNGTSPISSSAQYIVQPVPAGVVVTSPAGGTTAGGETVTVSGQYLGTATAPPTVKFVNVKTQAVTNVTTAITVAQTDASGNGIQITFAQPALGIGTYDTIVTNATGSSTAQSTDQFAVGPVIEYVSPRSGPKEGGTLVTISGANLSGATAVNFGNVVVTNIPSNTSTSLTVTAPPLSPGKYNITVTAAAGTSLVVPIATFTAGTTVTNLTPNSQSLNPASAVTVTITGADLTGATEVDFGSIAVTTGIVVNNAGTQLTVSAPTTLPLGVYDVVVKSPNGTSIASMATQYIVAPLTTTFTNSTGLGSTPIYAAVFGQLAFNKTTGALDPAPSNLADDVLVECYFNAQGQFAPTAPLYIGHPGPNFATVPTFQLQFVNNVATFNLPHIYNNSARIIMGVNVAPVAQIIDASGQIAAPDPTTDNIYDFLEFTLDQTNTLYSNTSQIDQVGVPFSVTVDPADPNVPGGVGILVPRNDIFGHGPNSFSTYLSSIGGSASQFAICATQSGSTVINDTNYARRLLAPADLLAQVPANSLSTYFDSALTTLYSTTRTNWQLIVPNPNVGKTAADGNTTNPGDSALENYTFTGTTDTTNHQIVLTSIVGGQSVTLPVYAPTSGGSLMVFACNGVFADNASRYGTASPLTSFAGLEGNMLGNIENQIVSALNRGIINLSTSAYPNTTQAWIGTTAGHNQDHLEYYQVGSTSNFYAGYLHANIAGGDVSQNELAYGYAYDDQGGQSSTQASFNPTSLAITLSSWAATPGAVAPDSNADYVNDLYKLLLNRAPDDDGFSFWTQSLTDGKSRADVANSILHSDEYQSIYIHNLYTELLHRAPDPSGMAFYLGEIASGVSNDTIKSQFYGSSEYFETRGHSTNAGFLDAVYHDELSRAIDASGLATWSAALASGQSRQAVALSILGSVEADQDLVRAYYGSYLTRAVETAGLNYWTPQLQDDTPDADVLADIFGSDEFYFKK